MSEINYNPENKPYYYMPKGNDMEDSPLQFSIWKNGEDEDTMMAWVYEEEFAKEVVEALNHIILLSQ